MARIQNVEQAEEAYGFTKPLRTYSLSDFDHIDRRLDRYWENGRFNRNRFLVDCGALTEWGAVIVENYHYEKNRVGENYGVIDNPSRFQRAHHLMTWYLSQCKMPAQTMPDLSTIYHDKKLADIPF